MAHPVTAIAVAAAVWLAGCAFAPRTYLRLDEADRLFRAASADAVIAYHAAAELGEAREVLERARAARGTLDDPALVDHLAYVAKRRTALAVELARQRGAP